MDVLLRIENLIRRDIDQNQICLVAYIDFTSAFDKVWGEGVVYKLIKCGLRGNLLKIIDNFFHDRKIAVVINNVNSDRKSISAGTPQGSALSPMLFNLMMSDLPKQDNIKIYSYADDVMLASSGPNMREISNNMQCIIIYKKIQFLPIHGCVTSGCRLIPDVLRWGRGTLS